MFLSFLKKDIHATIFKVFPNSKNFTQDINIYFLVPNLNILEYNCYYPV